MRGLRGEAQKETEIGPVPESWEDGATRVECEQKLDYGASGRCSCQVSDRTPRFAYAEYLNRNVSTLATSNGLAASILRNVGTIKCRTRRCERFDPYQDQWRCWTRQLEECEVSEHALRKTPCSHFQFRFDAKLYILIEFILTV